jgi:hypothetical protein
MIPGFNHNIKHKGRIFHIQTEDSGTNNPHIITHLFVGGNILASKKTEYTDLVGQPEYEKTVRSMMEEQHKQMLRNLINGVYDSIDTGKAYHLDGPAPINTEGQPPSPATAAMAGAHAHEGSPSAAPAEPEPVAVASTPPPAAPTVPPEVQAAQSLAPEEVPEEKPAPNTTLFGEELISEKSLDEVILSYLAEDLAGGD